MALHWVDICRTALALTPFKTLRFAHIGAVLLVVSFVSLQVFITISQLQQIRNRKLLFADTFCMAVIMGLMIPLYLYYGCLFVGRLKMVRKDKEGKRDYLIRKIRVMSFGPAVAGILSILMLVIKLICLHKNPFLFLIGESINHFTELIAVALFLYGILLDASVKGTPFLMKKSTISWSFRTA
ncbi:hypothetical protein BSLG_003504 [Batrachochytrium salamandrivorans]|nr:hypothetical protein BSLG_003504 [Batrachochytrium salamandrivorans]